jgi:hypothetical protein
MHFQPLRLRIETEADTGCVSIVEVHRQRVKYALRLRDSGLIADYNGVKPWLPLAIKGGCGQTASGVSSPGVVAFY